MRTWRRLAFQLLLPAVYADAGWLPGCTISVQSRLAIGNCVEAASDKVTAQSAGSAMPTRYSHEKAVTAGVAWLHMLVGLDFVPKMSQPRPICWADVVQIRPKSAQLGSQQMIWYRSTT